MLLEIRHRTQFRYAAPVRESVMEVWMQPQKTARQRLVSFDLAIDPAAHLYSYADSFGNAVYHFDVPQPHQQLAIRAISAVETSPAPPLPDELDRGEWSRLTSDYVRGECYEYLQPHGFAAPTERLTAFMGEHGLETPGEHDPLNACRRLTEQLSKALAYAPGLTEADSPIDLALEHKSGVCQDFAHIMIAIARQWGVPARYVSGYVYDPDSTGQRPDATHAWVEVFLPTLRWVGFDPTHNVTTGERYVPVAVGRDYGDAPPSRGVYKGDADSDLFVAVSVAPARLASMEPELVRASRPRPKRESASEPVAAYREYQQQQQ